MLIDCPCCKQQLNLDIVSGRPVLSHPGNKEIKPVDKKPVEEQSDAVKLFSKLGSTEMPSNPNEVIIHLLNLK